MQFDKMKEYVRKGQMSRRDFVRLALATGMTVAAADAAFLKAARADPKKGGTFRIAVGSGATTDSLDPATFPDTFNGIWGWASIRSSLTEVLADGSIVGDLAEHFERRTAPRPGCSRSARGSSFTTASR